MSAIFAMPSGSRRNAPKTCNSASALCGGTFAIGAPILSCLLTTDKANSVDNMCIPKTKKTTVACRRCEACFFQCLVGPAGIEPATVCLKGNCSTDWAMDPNEKSRKNGIIISKKILSVNGTFTSRHMMQALQRMTLYCTILCHGRASHFNSKPQ